MALLRVPVALVTCQAQGVELRVWQNVTIQCTYYMPSHRVTHLWTRLAPALVGVFQVTA